MKNRKIKLKISGMSCANCATTIEKKLTNNGYKDVNVTFSLNEVSCVLEENQSLKDVKSLIKKIGYNIEEKENKISVERLFIISLFFTIPLFLHMFFPKEHILNNILLQFILCLPVYCIGVWYFGRSAWFSIKNGSANMDLLIFIGSSAAFFYSIYGCSLFLGTSEIHNFLFFETTATIITLVLLGNVLEHKSVKQTTTAIKELSDIQNIIAKKEENDKIIDVEYNQIELEDILLVNTGDQIPVDGIIVWGEGDLDESMITGESIPVSKEIGDNLIGGTILTSGNIKIKATKVRENTLLSQIIKLVNDAQNNKPDIQRLGDKVSSFFVPIVLVISITTFFISYSIFMIDGLNSFLRAISVLVISCPCAMGLATPTAVMVGIGRAAKQGILIKGGKTLEKISKIKCIVFDKTGTITTGNFSINKLNILKGEEKYVKSIIYNLEKHSSHPIAVSLHNAYKQESSIINLDQITEKKGFGISGYYNNNKYEIGSSRILKEISEPHDIYLLENNKLIATIDIQDEIKSKTSSVINYLKKINYSTILLSGDTKKKCEEISNEINFDNVLFEKLPEEKLIEIEKLNSNYPTAMIGDGINDSPALAKSYVGISLGNATQIAIQSSDIVLLNNQDLTQIPKMLQIGKHTVLTIKQNLFWAFAYNIIAIPIAAFGFIPHILDISPPMWAALFMAFSDVIVIGNSIRLKYKNIY